ncbi:MAG: transcription termination/antitermination protein NusG [bacterium]
MGEKNWYVIHTLTGREMRVAEAIRKVAERKNLGHLFNQILVPTEDISMRRKGKTVIKKKILYSGYVFIEMELTDDSWALVKKTTGVTGFIGTSRNKPQALNIREVEEMMTKLREGSSIPKEQIPYEKGDPVTVIGGPFTGFSGVVEEIFPDRGKVKVIVTVFERSTPLELDIPLVEKV